MARSVASRVNPVPWRNRENAVFHPLRRQGQEIAYHRTASAREVDFVYKDEAGKTHLLQVCWSMEDAGTRDREISALDEAIRELKPADAAFITHRQEETLEISGKRIQVIPAWRFLLT